MAVATYAYPVSSVAEVPAALENVGASLVSETVIVKLSVTDAVPSVTVITTLWSPTLTPAGVPVRAPVEASNDSQAGTVVPAIVRVSDVSASDAVTVYA